MKSLITVKHPLPVQAETGETRVVLCLEEQIDTGTYCIPTGVQNYEFEDGGPAAKIGDSFLDRTGNIYRRIANRS
jgi:hypothetical protein